MSDQRVSEFRERAESAVRVPPPEEVLQRGRILRRRRQLVPATVVAVGAVVAVGLLYPVGDRPQSDVDPTAPATSSAGSDAMVVLGSGNPGHALESGTYLFDDIAAGGPVDATVELAGGDWLGWNGGAHQSRANATVSWGLGDYEDAIIDQCRPERHATSRAGAVAQLSEIPGTVTRPARPASAMGLEGTYLQVEVPVDVECRRGEPTGGNLFAMWPGSAEPTVTVDVWLLEDGDRLLLLTSAVHGTPHDEMLENLDDTVASLQLVPHG